MSSSTRRRLLTGGAAALGWSTLGCAGLVAPGGPLRTADLDHPPQLDHGATDRRPTQDREELPGPGWSRIRIEQDGLGREALVFRPGGRRPRPLLMATHGNGGTSRAMFETHELGAVCEAQGWIGVFPETDVCAPSDPLPDLADLRFLSALLDRVLAEERADAKRVFAVGFSGGGMKTYRLAAERSERIAAIACCSSTVGHLGQGWEGWDPGPHRALPVSILHVHGEKDTVIDPKGERIEGRGVERVPLKDGLGRWVDHLGASEETDPRPRPGLPERARLRRWRAGGTTIEGVMDPELGHRWPLWMNRTLVDLFETCPTR